jgi:hypothetical protein
VEASIATAAPTRAVLGVNNQIRAAVKPGETLTDTSLGSCETNVRRELRSWLTSHAADGYRAPSGRFVELTAALEASTRGTVEYPPERALHPALVSGPPPRITVENQSILVVGRRMVADDVSPLLRRLDADVRAQLFGRREVRVRRPSVVADGGTHPRTVAGLRRMEEHPLVRMRVVVAKTR